MNHEPIDLSMERRVTSTTRDNQPRRRSTIRPYFAPIPAKAASTAPPEALDEVFAALARNSCSAAQAAPAKPALNAAPLVALAANLERQHERLASFLRELETGSAS
jgi:hypothetical protein